MRYFIVNGTSPHLSMWETADVVGACYPAGELKPASLIGANVVKVGVDSPEILEIIKEKLPGVKIPPISENKTISKVEVGDHIVCMYTSDNKPITKESSGEDFLLKDTVIIPPPQY